VINAALRYDGVNRTTANTRSPAATGGTEASLTNSSTNNNSTNNSRNRFSLSPNSDVAVATPMGLGANTNTNRTNTSARSPLLQPTASPGPAGADSSFVGPQGTSDTSSPLTQPKSPLTHADVNVEEYENTLRCSALLPDLEVLPDGDVTQIGDRGVTLSGGQKARVAIARAIYDSDNAQVFVFDDVLSAVDSHVASHLIQECLLGKLKKKCVR
jgi:hypothetical protein